MPSVMPACFTELVFVSSFLVHDSSEPAFLLVCTTSETTKTSVSLESYYL